MCMNVLKIIIGIKTELQKDYNFRTIVRLICDTDSTFSARLAQCACKPILKISESVLNQSYYIQIPRVPPYYCNMEILFIIISAISR